MQFQTLTVASNHFRLYLALLAVLGTGCESQGPTAPAPGPKAVVPTPTALPATLSGSWSGTFRTRGLMDDGDCPPNNKTATLQVTQTGRDVEFVSPTAGRCSGAGSLTFRGSLSDRSLSGYLNKDAASGVCALSGRADGTAERTRIELDGSMQGACNDVGIHITLTR